MSAAELTAKALASRGGYWLKRPRRASLLAFGVAFVLRALFVVWLNYAPSAQGLSVKGYANDSFVYDALARSLANGQGYQIDGDYYWPSWKRVAITKRAAAPGPNETGRSKPPRKMIFTPRRAPTCV